MIIIGDNDLLLRQAFWREKSLKFLRPVGNGLFVCGLIGWGLIVALWQQNALTSVQLSVMFLVATMLVALALPRLADQLEREFNQLVTQQAAEQRLLTLLQSVIGEGWTLFKHDDNHRLTLVGNKGVFALQLVTGQSSHRNTGQAWFQREGQAHRWQPLPYNPTTEAVLFATQLDTQLAQQNLHCPIFSRIIWVGEAVLLLEDPATPVWLFNQTEAVHADIERQPLVDEAIINCVLTYCHNQRQQRNAQT